MAKGLLGMRMSILGHWKKRSGYYLIIEDRVGGDVWTTIVHMIVRRYRDDDLESVVGLFTDTVRHVNIRDYSSEQVAVWAPEPPDLVRWRERLANLSLWVAESDRRIIGFCGLDACGHVDLLYVDYRFQRRGVARRLYQRLETAARRRGLRRLFTEASITARPFFESMGFRCLREQRVELRGIVFENYRMEKRIAMPGTALGNVVGMRDGVPVEAMALAVDSAEQARESSRR